MNAGLPGPCLYTRLPVTERAKDVLGVLLALALAAGVVGWRFAGHRDQVLLYDRFDLPAFDSYVYLAMAEQPAFFTIAPWGYRVLTPWVAHALGMRTPLRAYRAITLWALALSGVLLYLWLRRLGHGRVAGLLGVAAFALSPPLDEVLASPFLGDPAAVLLVLAFVLLLEAGAPLTVLAFVAALGAYTKEVFVLLAPLVALARHRERGWRPASLDALAVAGAPFAVGLVLQRWWTPGLETTRAAITLDLVAVATKAILVDWRDVSGSLAVGGLAPVALLGALRRSARPYLRRYGYLLLGFLALPLVAWINVPGRLPVILLGANVRRLMIYAVPLLVPLALVALDRLVRHLDDLPPPGPWPRAAALGGAVALLATLAFPFAALDRYRRIEFPAVRDGPLVLMLCRGTLRTARLVESGKDVHFDLGEKAGPAPTHSDEVARLRWFLREGWRDQPDSKAHYGTGPAVLEADEAVVLVPVFTPSAREVALTLDAGGPVALEALVNGTPAGRFAVGPVRGEVTVRLPAAALFRGDNLLALRRPRGDRTEVRLHRVVWRAAAP